MKRRLSLDPQSIDDANWYYEERKGLTLVHEVRNATSGTLIRTDTVTIPWAMLAATFRRKWPEGAPGERSGR